MTCQNIEIMFYLKYATLVVTFNSYFNCLKVSLLDFSLLILLTDHLATKGPLKFIIFLSTEFFRYRFANFKIIF